MQTNKLCLKNIKKENKKDKLINKFYNIIKWKIKDNSKFTKKLKKWKYRNKLKYTS